VEDGAVEGRGDIPRASRRRTCFGHQVCCERFPLYSLVQLLSYITVDMSDAFRKSILNRLPPMAPTRAPWAPATENENMDEDEEELEGGDSMGDLGRR
jgi:hypothetical protein